MALEGVLSNWLPRAFQWLTSQLRKPKLNIHFNPDKTYNTARVRDHGNVLGFFCHLIISNEGKNTAINCRGRVIAIERRTDYGSFSPMKEFVKPILLKWANEADFAPRNVEHDIPRRLDLAYKLESHPESLILFTEPVPTGNLKVLLPGTYRVTVRVDAENADAVDRSFLIEHGDHWKDITVNTET